MIGFPQVKTVAMRDSVGDAIRLALYDGRFEAGQQLSEAGLAATMGISRGPVREALFLLVQEGLLAHEPNHGFSVIEITATDLHEIQEVRVPLETLALQLARAHMTEEDLNKLDEFKGLMVQAYRDGMIPLSSKFDMSFHSLIWDRTANARLALTLRTLLAPFFAYGALFNHHRRPDLSPELIEEEHERMIQFLRGARGSSEECVRFHLGL